MNIVKKVSAILIIMCIILSTTHNNIYAATTKQKTQVVIGISEYIDQNYPDIVDQNLSTSESQAAINDIAMQFKRLCASAGVPLSEMEAANYDIGWPGVAENGGLFTLVIRAAQNPNLGNQVDTPNETEDKRKELANNIRQKSAAGIKNINTADLIALDKLLNSFRTTYPGSWSQTDTEYYDLYFMAVEIQDEIFKRKNNGTGDTEIPADYKTAIEQQVSDRNDEQENLGNNGVPGLLGNSDVFASHTPDEIIKEAENFRNEGNATMPIDGDNIQRGSSSLYNILLSIGIFLAVAIGMYLGVKFMLSNAEDKAKVKEALIPYIAGCIVIFGAFIIWKLAITLLSGIDKVSNLPIKNEYVIAKQIDEK